MPHAPISKGSWGQFNFGSWPRICSKGQEETLGTPRFLSSALGLVRRGPRSTRLLRPGLMGLRFGLRVDGPQIRASGWRGS